MGQGRPAKKRRITPPIDDSKVSETIKASDIFHRAADWDLEQDYERSSRRKKVKENTRLPIKTAQGEVQRVAEEVVSSDDADSFLGSSTDDEAEDDDTPPTDDSSPKIEVPLLQQIREAKEEIARLANLINEDPEEHAGSFRKLAQVAGPSAHIAVKKLALAAQAAVFKDVIPGYRIRAYNDEDLGTKVSKDIRRTRQYEQALITSYQMYVKDLVRLTKGRANSGSKRELKTVALSCACTLVLAVPHFNFRTELLSILVHEASGRDPTPDYIKAIETLEKFFQIDEDGAPSLEAVNQLSKMMKAVDYNVREEVLNTFMHLRLLSELTLKASTTEVDKAEADPKLHGRKIKKEKSTHRSKKERKIARERKAVEKDMREANAAVDYEAREKMQSETLKAVFVAYFRILKARIPHLMGAVLEGLAKYAHLINQDFFGDVLEALKDIVTRSDAAITNSDDAETADQENNDDDGDDNNSSNLFSIRNRTRESLLSTQTAFTLLSQQEVSKSASELHLDLSFFTSHVYRSLYPLSMDPDIELGPKSLHLLDPHQGSHTPYNRQATKYVAQNQNRSNGKSNTKTDNSINISTPVLLLTRALTNILLNPLTNQSTSPQTISTFFKRLLTISLELPEKSTTAILTILLQIAHKHTRKIEPLWYTDERKGDGIFNGLSDSLVGSNIFSVGSGVWEGELLRCHWVPSVREQWREMEGLVRNLNR